MIKVKEDYRNNRRYSDGEMKDLYDKFSEYQRSKGITLDRSYKEYDDNTYETWKNILNKAGIRSVENFKKQNELTDEMMDALKEYYDDFCVTGKDDWYTGLSYLDYLYKVLYDDNGSIYCTILEDFVEW